jgi:hypothetical protein
VDVQRHVLGLDAGLVLDLDGLQAGLSGPDELRAEVRIVSVVGAAGLADRVVGRDQAGGLFSRRAAWR